MLNLREIQSTSSKFVAYSIMDAGQALETLGEKWLANQYYREADYILNTTSISRSKVAPADIKKAAWVRNKIDIYASTLQDAQNLYAESVKSIQNSDFAKALDILKEANRIYSVIKYNMMTDIRDLYFSSLAQDSQNIEQEISSNIQKVIEHFENFIEPTLKSEKFREILSYETEAYDAQLVANIQIGNKMILAEDFTNAQLHFNNIVQDFNLQTIDLDSLAFYRIESQIKDRCEKLGYIQGMINCMLTLLKVDSELTHENYYTNLACYYAINEQINEANETFVTAINSGKVCSALYTEYAQFLIKNAPNLNVNTDIISHFLYSAINASDSSTLSYGRLEQKTLCNILQEFIETNKNNYIEISAKVLAYYLLITNTEYIKTGDTFQNLTTRLQSLCLESNDSLGQELLKNIVENIATDAIESQTGLTISANTEIDSEQTLPQIAGVNDQIEEELSSPDDLQPLSTTGESGQF